MKTTIIHGIEMRTSFPKRAKLTEHDVIEIRGAFKEGDINISQLAKIYKTSRSNINRIIDGETFKHLEVFPRPINRPRTYQRTHRKH